MKKILLTIASVLALALFASCQNETSGDLTISNEQNSDSWSYGYYYTPSGSWTVTTKTTVAGPANSTTTTSVEYTADSDWTGSWTKSRKRNEVIYKFAGNANVLNTASNGTQTTGSRDSQTIRIYKRSGSYYLNGTRLSDFNPESSTVNLNFTTTETSTAKSTTTTVGDTTTTTKITTVYALTLTRK